LYTATERFDPRRELEHWLEREGFLNIPFEGGLYLAVNTPSFERGLDTEERISLMEDAVRVSPRNVPFHLILANLYLEEGRSEEALSESQEALKRVITSQEKIAAHLQLGRLYLRLGQKDAARAQFEAVLTISPNNPEARLSLSGLKE
jgi:tetratricopeptide (TPR) repeat protein